MTFDHLNSYIFKFKPINIEYYYYSNKKWILDNEQICDNINDLYIDYIDNTNHIYHQHKIEFPQILLPFTSNMNSLC